MGRIFVVKKTGLFLCMVLMGLALSGANTALANSSCQLQNTFPSGQIMEPSHFGASRGSRLHAGVDFYYTPGTTISIPEGCEIRLYSDGTVIWKSDPTGYGQYMFVDCNVGGVPLTLRYAHIAQYITSTSQIEQGRTGIEDPNIADHYHFEVLISQSAGKGTPVDPECVLGMEKNGGRMAATPGCDACPTPPGPVDFCTNKDAVAQLISHSQKCYKGPDKNNPGGEKVDPSRLTGVPNQGDPSSSASTPNGKNEPDVHGEDFKEPDPGDAFTGDVNKLYPKGDDFPPVEPPSTPIQGTPGDDPILTPEPSTPPNKVSGCATDTWTSMVNQAVMETRREDIMNKRFIVKADSVLDYSCFGHWMKGTALMAGPIFSETNLWDNRSVNLLPKTVTVQLSTKDQTTAPFNTEADYNLERTVTNSKGSSITYKLLGPNSLDAALDLVVSTTANAYVNANFNHPFLAGSTPVSPPAASCDMMANIWKAAKCKNFDATNPFPRFEDLVSYDPREFPSNMACN